MKVDCVGVFGMFYPTSDVKYCLNILTNSKLILTWTLNSFQLMNWKIINIVLLMHHIVCVSRCSRIMLEFAQITASLSVIESRLFDIYISYIIVYRQRKALFLQLFFQVFRKLSLPQCFVHKTTQEEHADV